MSLPPEVVSLDPPLSLLSSLSLRMSLGNNPAGQTSRTSSLEDFLANMSLLTGFGALGQSETSLMFQSQSKTRVFRHITVTGTVFLATFPNIETGPSNGADRSLATLKPEYPYPNETTHSLTIRKKQFAAQWFR